MTPHFHLRHLFAISVLGLATLVLSGKTITPEEAIAGVSGKHNAPGYVRKQASDANFVNCVTTEKGEPALYLFDMQQKPGYLILSADDRLPLVLGYSENGNLSDPDLPEGLRWWIEMIADEAGAVFSEAGDTGSDIYTPPSLGPAVEPLVKAVWGQNAPFNMFTPIIDEKQSPTGCVATAITQVMNHYKWPVNPKGEISYKDLSSSSNIYSMTFDGMTFDWDLIADTYNDDSSEDSKIAVADLMKAVGYGVRMTYGKSESSTSDTYALEGMINYFGYTKDAKIFRRESFTRDEWEKLLYFFLSKGHPLFYSGRDAVWLGSGGHAFVCDGYDGNGYFHYNWGWDGRYNGYFLTSCLTPAGAGTGGYINGYNYSQTIMANLYPDNGIVYDKYEYVLADSFSLSMSDKNVTSTLISNFSEGVSFETGLSLTCDGSDNHQICWLGQGKSGKNTWSLTDDFINNLDESKAYDLRFVWRSDNESEWEKVIPESKGLLVYNPVYISGQLIHTKDQWQFTPGYLDFDRKNLHISNVTINDADYFLSGKINNFSFTLTNADNDYAYQATRCYAINVETGKEEIFFNTSLEARPSESMDIKYTIKESKTLPAGEYTLRFMDVNYLADIPTDKQYTMKVYDDSQVISFDDGTFVYSLIPDQPLILTGTVGGGKASGDVVIPDEVSYQDQTYSVGKMQLSLSNLIDKTAVTSLRIDYPLTKIGNSELSSCKALTELHLPESLRSVGQYGCAYNSSLKKLTMPPVLDYLGPRSFYGISELEELEMPVVDTIPDRCFYNCKKLQKIVIPEGVKSIGNGAFYYCDELNTLELPSTLESIASMAFITYSDVPMEVSVYRNDPPAIESIAFGSAKAKISKLIVPKGSVESYRQDPYWGKFGTIEELITTGIDEIRDSSDLNLEWFDLSGVRLEDKPTNPGVYVRRNITTGAGEKVVVK